jgi:hypothetical protein
MNFYQREDFYIYTHLHNLFGMGSSAIDENQFAATLPA